MRRDEKGNECPETLGEYLDFCQAIGGPDCEAVRFLNEHIARNKEGRDAKVVAADSQMRALLMPKL